MPYIFLHIFCTFPFLPNILYLEKKSCDLLLIVYVEEYQRQMGGGGSGYTYLVVGRVIVRKMCILVLPSGSGVQIFANGGLISTIVKFKIVSPITY